MTTELVLHIEKPNIPAKWDYDESVKKVRRVIYKWGHLTKDMMCDLWIAREKTSVSKSDAARIMHGTNVPCRTWEGYCEDIGCEKRTVNRWLSFWFESGSLVGKLTGNAENYTPAALLEKVREVLGEIDLDPASCDLAQKLVKAKCYYTEKEDGLSKSWSGRVFLNPPYGMPAIRDFANKLIEELPHINAAILLTNDQTDTDWWQKCAIYSNVVCFYGRIHFYTPDVAETQPTNGQTLMHFGDAAERFVDVFRDTGLLMKSIR